MDGVADGLFVGTASDAGDASALQKHGIDTVISLTHSEPETGGVTRVDVPMMDGPQNSYEAFLDAVDEVVKQRANGHRVLVHCSMGSSRSPAVAAAAITRLTEHTLPQSFDQVLANRPETDPHDMLVRQAVRTTENW